MSIDSQNAGYKSFTSLTALFDYVESKFIQAFASHEYPNFVKVEGIIKLGIRKNKYFFGRIYNRNQGISLWIPIELGDSLSEVLQTDLRGNVYGEIKIRGKSTVFEPYILVHDIQIKEISKEEIFTKRQEKNLLEIWKEYGTRYDRIFPDEPYISVIRPLTDTAYKDFETKLHASGFKIEDIPTDITSAESLTEAINKTRGNVLIILRGGGTEEAFSVFNDLKVVKTWASKEAFKVLAIGHTEHKGYLLEMFADAVKRTPTEAAEYLISEAKSIRELRECRELKGQIAILEKNKEEIVKERDDLKKQLHELQKDKTVLETEVRRLKSLEKESEKLQSSIKTLEVLKIQIAEKEKLLQEKDKRIQVLQREIEDLRSNLEERTRKISEINELLNQKEGILKREQKEKIKSIEKLKETKKNIGILLFLTLIVGLIIGRYTNNIIHYMNVIIHYIVHYIIHYH